MDSSFDPSKATMPRLRSILVTHEIKYPSNAKKPQLVELFAKHIQPQIPKLRAEAKSVRRSSAGIVDAGSAEDVAHWDSD